MYRLRTVSAGLLVSVAALSHGCGGGPAQPSPPATVVVSGLERYLPPLTPGVKIQLVATLQPSAGGTQDCTGTATWVSSNELLVRPTGQQPGEFLTVVDGDVTISATCSGTTGRLAVHVERATSWPVSGKVIAAPDGPPIAEATLTFGTSAPVRSDGSGSYTIVTEDGAIRPLSLSAPGFQTRETSLRGGQRRTVDIDVIGNDPVFPFNLYRMMVRNGHESPKYISTAPTQPWTMPPNVYIWTTWKDSGLPVANVEWYVGEIRRVIPQLTGGRFTAGRIEFGPEERPAAYGWINLQFHRSGNWAYLGANPGQVQLGADHTCNSYAVIHEFGHAMGYWHSSLVPSVMGGGPGSCTEINLWPPEQIVARTMYSRPRGNLDPDRDPPGAGVLFTEAAAPRVRVTCDRVLGR